VSDFEKFVRLMISLALSFVELHHDNGFIPKVTSGNDHRKHSLPLLPRTRLGITWFIFFIRRSRELLANGA